ncbi:serine hydrolase [Salinimonas chungwhensis]|uniref:serine hydrolase n=1 Tax=Salinimonas chungwhensis TaxID=265425 RepID=UPI00037AA3F7|nr:serine hydrolase [Salinimonas chungwhensis]
MRLLFRFFISLLLFAGFSVIAQDQPKWAIERIDNHLTRSIEHGFSGAVLIANGNNLILKKGYGDADRESQKPITTATLFDIGSVTKQFTAAAILLLEKEEKLSVKDTLARYFPSVPQDKQSITVHQLLTHTAGLPGGVGIDDFTHVERDAFFNRVMKMDLLEKPGETFHYSNVGYSLLARIIELASGQPYETFLQQRLFQPANMQQTGYLQNNIADQDTAIGYREGVVPVATTLSRYRHDNQVAWSLKGNGGLISSLDDMYSWYLALRNNVILDTEQIDKLTKAYVKQRPDNNIAYGYGWSVFDSPKDTKMVGHNGSNGVYYFDLRWLKNEDLVIIYASNAMVQDTPSVSENIELMLFDHVFNPPTFAAGPVTEILRVAVAFTGPSETLQRRIKSRFETQLQERYVLNRAGLALLDVNQVERAIALLSLNVTLFENDGNLWDSLGEAYLAANKFEDAKRCFVNALVMAPAQRCYWCDNAKAKLAAIKQRQR